MACMGTTLPVLPGVWRQAHDGLPGRLINENETAATHNVGRGLRNRPVVDALGSGRG
jgi:hypothetical protein